jgi:hypothetical protein
MLFVILASLMRNTYSGDVMEMSLHTSVAAARRLGIEEDVIARVVTAVGQHWNANRMFAGMF